MEDIYAQIMEKGNPTPNAHHHNHPVFRAIATRSSQRAPNIRAANDWSSNTLELSHIAATAFPIPLILLSQTPHEIYH